MFVTRIDRGEDLRQGRVGVFDGEVPIKPYYRACEFPV